jgi:hypothetical protein
MVPAVRGRIGVSHRLGACRSPIQNDDYATLRPSKRSMPFCAEGKVPRGARPRSARAPTGGIVLEMRLWAVQKLGDDKDELLRWLKALVGRTN